MDNGAVAETVSVGLSMTNDPDAKRMEVVELALDCARGHGPELRFRRIQRCRVAIVLVVGRSLFGCPSDSPPQATRF